jgi:hypothetical protein
MGTPAERLQIERGPKRDDKEGEQRRDAQRAAWKAGLSMQAHGPDDRSCARRTEAIEMESSLPFGSLQMSWSAAVLKAARRTLLPQ